MLRMIPPAGSELPSKIIALSALSCTDTADLDFAASLREYLCLRNIFLFGSGRASLTILLQTLAQKSSRDEVLIPAYTCFSVPSAIVRAGLKIRLCDVNLETLDFDISMLSRLLDERVLSIIPSNLFGLVNNIPEIARLAKAYETFVIDDAAQSLGADLKGTKSGAMGDVGILSLGRGKSISTYEGGAIVTNSEGIAHALTEHPLLNGRRPKRWPQASNLIRLIGYSSFLHPRLFWIPNQFPLFGLGTSKFDPYFKIDGLSSFQCALGIFVLRELDQFNAQRRKNAQHLQQQLEHNPLIRLPIPLPGSQPIYLRFPLLFRERSLRDAIYQKLLRSGIGASKMYPAAIHRIPEIRANLTNGNEEFPNAELLTSSILTLPTHTLITKRDLDVMVEVLCRSTD